MTEFLLGLPDGPKVRLLSRDEDKQERMAQRFPAGARISYFLGDVRSVETLCRAFDGADVVIHAAAYKRVSFGERNPAEFNETNANGSWNVVRAAIECGVGRSLLISSDKACAPLSNYGVSKRMAEGLFIQGNSIGVGRGCLFSATRGGNIWNSRGSVAQIWKSALERGEPLQVNGEVSRFHLEMPRWVQFNWDVITRMGGGEIFIPRARSWNLIDLARAFSENITVGPARPGDKAAEWLYSGDESYRVTDAGWAFVLEPPADFRRIWNYQPWPGEPVPPGVPYASDSAPKLSADELRQLVREL